MLERLLYPFVETLLPDSLVRRTFLDQEPPQYSVIVEAFAALFQVDQFYSVEEIKKVLVREQVIRRGWLGDLKLKRILQSNFTYYVGLEGKALHAKHVTHSFSPEKGKTGTVLGYQFCVKQENHHLPVRLGDPY